MKKSNDDKTNSKSFGHMENKIKKEVSILRVLYVTLMTISLFGGLAITSVFTAGQYTNSPAMATGDNNASSTNDRTQ